MLEIEHILQLVIGAVLSGGLAYIWWDIRRIRKVNDEKLDANDSKVKVALYNKDGTTIFMPRSECGRLHLSFCRKIDEVKTVFNEARKEDSEDRKQLYRLLGRVQAHMDREDKNHG